MTVLVAVIGLVGTLAASSAVGEWLRRRDLREAIKVDLEIWHKLPHGNARDRLMGRIEHQIDELHAKPERRRAKIRGFADLILIVSAVACGLVLTAINGGYHWVRGADGILRMVAVDGMTVEFRTVVMKIALCCVLLLVLSTFLRWATFRVLDRLFGRHTERGRHLGPSGSSHRSQIATDRQTGSN